MTALRILAMAGLACLVVAVALGAWLHLNDWRLPWRAAPEGELPVIEAPPAPHKERPEDPGGYQPENLGVGILESAGGREPEGPVRLLPPPEEPLPRPGAGEGAPAAGQPERLPMPSGAGQDPAAEGAATTPAEAVEETVPAEADAATAPSEADAEATPAGTDEEAAPAETDEEAPPAEEVVETAPAEAGSAPPPEGAATTADRPAEVDEEGTASALGPPVPPGPKPAPPRAGAAGAPPPSGAAAGAPGVWIQLASLVERAPAEREWRRLERKHPEILGPLREKRIEEVAMDDGRMVFRLQAGAFADADRAQAACTALKAEGTDCFVVDPLR